MLDAMMFQSNGYLTLGAMGLPLERLGNQFSFSIPTNVYQCRDGSVMAGVLLDTHWKVLAKMCGRNDLAENPNFANIPGRIANRAECNRLFAEFCAARTIDEAVAECARHSIPCAKVRTYAEAAADENTRERDMLIDVPHAGGGTIPITGTSPKFSRTPTTVRSPSPALGADTDSVLERIGLDADARARLRKSGVI
jgi:formyl-CoA transferase